jgi:hypothetical protein
MVKMAGNKKLGILIMFLLLDKTIKIKLIIMSKIDRTFIAIYFICFTCYEAPMQIQRISLGYWAQLTEILISVTLLK